MEYLAGKKEFKYVNSAITLGKFDGLHLGHQFLIDQVVSCKSKGYKTIIFSFLYHPYNLFSEKEFKQIYTEEEKYDRISRKNLDVMISYPFTEETKNVEPEDFIKDILVEQLDAKIIVVGEDYHFGHRQRGDIKLLQKYEKTYGYQVISCEKKKWNNQIISSSFIRNELNRGNIEVVNEMLGQPFGIRGEVLHGRKIGRTLQMPTVNLLPPDNKLLPPNGVYASLTLVDGKYYYSVTNIGYKPTVGGEKRKGVETFVFDFDQDLYGKVIEVDLFTYLRVERKFASLELLKQQMQEDMEMAKNYFHNR